MRNPGMKMYSVLQQQAVQLGLEAKNKLPYVDFL